MATPQSRSTDHIETDKEWKLFKTFDDNGKPFKMAMGIAQCPNDDFVIADPVEIRVGLFTSAGVFRMNLNDNDGGKLFKPSDVDTTADGLVVVVDKSPDVKVYNADSGLFAFSFKTIQNGIGTEDVPTSVCPAAVTVHQTIKTEYIYVLDILLKTVTCHKTNGTCVKTILVGGTPNYLSVINSDRFIVSDYTMGKFCVIDTSGRDILVMEAPIDELGRKSNAVGTCIDPINGDFLVALGRRQGHCVIHRYSNELGKFAGCIATKLTNPFNMIITMDGKLAVADKNTVKIYMRK